MQVYVVDPAVLTAIMMVSIIASLPVAAVLFLIQLAAEGARLRREALARRAALRLPTCEWQLAEGQSYVCLCFRRLNAGRLPSARSDGPKIALLPRSLSHYKVEAGADARYLKDALDKMLGCPAYLDSSTLAECARLQRSP